MILLSQLITEFLPALWQRYGPRLLPSHLHALNAMARCRTAANPIRSLIRCLTCGHCEHIPMSCGHRNCPHCQHQQCQQWLDRHRAKLLPTEYFLVTFTLPQQLRGFALSHQKFAYDLLMRLGWQTLATFAANDKQLQGKLGATAVLHTHARNLDYHPHVHFIVPAGALDPEQRIWRKKRGKYLFRGKSLAKVFRAKWFEAMTEAGYQVTQTLPGAWIVDCKHVGRGDAALTYLGKYLYRGVLREKDIIRCQDGKVTFRYTTNKGQVKTRTLAGEEFLWLLLQHVLPRGFRRSRDYGLHHANSKKLIALVQLFFSTNLIPTPQDPEPPTCRCKACSSTNVIIVHYRVMPQAQPT